ncbi:MAG: hypothetical protein Q9191_001054 [Dirinaria sp. TL-2023a]
MAPSHHHEAADYLDHYLYLGRIVSYGKGPKLLPVADMNFSVVLVSIIWIVVLSRLEQTDVTWNYINAGIWSALEPNMAVVCACIPSLRPLITIVTRGVFNHPLVKSTMKSGSSTLSKRGWGSLNGRTTDGLPSRFSHLDEQDDLRPLGHGVFVRGGRLNDGSPDMEDVEIPQHGINVRTEITLETSDRLIYNDRLY